MEIQALGIFQALAPPPEEIMETPPTSSQLTGKLLLMPSINDNTGRSCVVHINFNINTELDSLREVNQQLSEDNQELRDQLVLVQLSEGIIETQPISAQLMGKSFLMPSVTT